MKVPKLIADEWSGEGDLLMPDNWNENSALLKMDLLSDWVYLLERQYNAARVEFKAELTIKKAMSNK